MRYWPSALNKINALRSCVQRDFGVAHTWVFHVKQLIYQAIFNNFKSRRAFLVTQILLVGGGTQIGDDFTHANGLFCFNVKLAAK